jgi:hypothetical protein
LHRINRQIDPLNFLGGVASNIINIPTKVVTNIMTFILSVISRIRSEFLSFLEYVESWVIALTPQIDSSENSDQRQRRSTVSNGLSDLIANLPNLLESPLSYFQEATSSAADTAGTQIDKVVRIVARLIWNFFTTKLLPWIHDVLKKLQQTNILPSFFNQAIENADSLYSFLQLLSVMVNPGSA